MNHINNHPDNHWDGWSDEQMWKKIERSLITKKRRKIIIAPLILLLFSGIPLYLIFLNKKDAKTLGSPISEKMEVEGSAALKKAMNKESTSISERKFQNENKLSETDPSEIKKKNKYQTDQSIDVNKSKQNNDLKRNVLVEFTDQKQLGFPDQNEIFSELNITKDPDPGILTHPKINQLTKTHRNISPIPSKTKYLSKSIQNFDYLFSSINYYGQNLNTNFKKPKYSVQFSNGFGYGKRSDKFNTSIEWELQKNTNEQYLYTTSHEISISGFSGSGFFYSLGLDYHRIISNVKGENITIDNQIIFSDSARVQTINELKYYYPGSLTRTITVTDHYNVYNTYSGLYLPVKMGFRFGDKKNIYYLGFGTQIILYKQLKGYTTDQDLRIKPIQNTISYTETREIYLSDIIGSFQYDRKINKSFSLLLGLHGQMPIKPMIIQIDNSENKFESYYSSYFIKLGLKWNIE